MARGPGGLTLATSFVAQGFTLITGVIAARALGVDGRGTLALLWLCPLILALLGGIGIPAATTYYVARHRDHSRSIIRTSLLVTVALAVGLSALYAVALLVFAGGDHDFNAADSALSVAMIPAFLGQNLAVAALLGQERFRIYNAVRIIPVAGYAFFSVIVVTVGAASLTSILASAFSGWVVALAISWTAIGRSAPDIDDEPPVGRSQITRFGLRGVVGSVSPIDDVRLDQFMVGLLLDAHALGLYVAAIAFCNIPRFVAQSVGAVSYPRVAAERRGPQAWGLTVHYFRIGIIAIIGSAAILMLIVPTLLPLMFGHDFEAAIPLGRILLTGTLFLALHRLLTELARGLGHPGYGSISEAVNATVFLAVVFLALNPITESGIAWSVVAGGVCCSSLLAFLLFRLRGPLMDGEPNAEAR